MTPRSPAGVFLKMVGWCVASVGFAVAVHASSPDVSEIKEAVRQLISVLDTIEKDVATMTTAAEVAKAIDSWARANNQFENAMLEFARRYPDAITGPEPPKELIPSSAELHGMKAKYGPSLAQLQTLTERFRDDPAVQKAVSGLRNSVDRVQSGEDGAN